MHGLKPSFSFFTLINRRQSYFHPFLKVFCFVWNYFSFIQGNERRIREWAKNTSKTGGRREREQRGKKMSISLKNLSSLVNYSFPASLGKTIHKIYNLFLFIFVYLFALSVSWYRHLKNSRRRWATLFSFPIFLLLIGIHEFRPTFPPIFFLVIYLKKKENVFDSSHLTVYPFVEPHDFLSFWIQNLNGQLMKKKWYNKNHGFSHIFISTN